MEILALAFYGIYLGLAFGLRSLLQRRATGSTGFIGLGGRPGSPEWFAGVLFAVAIVAGAVAPALAVADVLDAVPALQSGTSQVIGAAIAILGIAATVYAQVAMGSSWRIGVDPDEKTELVTHGPFGLVRNPIFSAMIPTALGLTLMVPSIVGIAGLASLLTALELQVRVVEEPYLLRAQGAAYRRYASRVGRFIPGVGRIPLG